MQARSPVPKGLYACAGRVFTAAGSKRSGSSFSGSGHTAGPRCTSGSGTVTQEDLCVRTLFAAVGVTP
jgi:hypothetical protein